MAAIRLRNWSIIKYPQVVVPLGFLAISIITLFSYYTWPTSRNALSPYFSRPQEEHSELEEVRHVRIAIEEAGGSLSFYQLEQPDATVLHLIQGTTKRSLEP